MNETSNLIANCYTFGITAVTKESYIICILPALISKQDNNHSQRNIRTARPLVIPISAAGRFFAYSNDSPCNNQHGKEEDLVECKSFVDVQAEIARAVQDKTDDGNNGNGHKLNETFWDLVRVFVIVVVTMG